MMVASFLERRLSGRSANANISNIRCAFRVSIKDKNNWQVPSDRGKLILDLGHALNVFFIANFQILT